MVMPCVSVKAKKRIVSLDFCGKGAVKYLPKVFLVWPLHSWLLTIPHVTHGQLYRKCMFNVMRKHDQ